MQGGNLVVKVVAAFVEASGVEGQGVFDEFRGDLGDSGGTGGGLALFEQIEHASGVAVGVADQGRHGSVGKLEMRQRLFLGAGEKLLQFIFRQGFQHVDLGPREQRRIDFEGGILGRRADQGQEATFHIGQKGVLLRFVETMHFIDKEDRRAPALCAQGFGVGDRFADVLDTGENRRQGDEFGVESISHQPCQRGFADPRRPPEDQ